MASTRGSTDQRGRRSTRKPTNPLGLAVVAAVLVAGGVLLYLNGPQVGPYLPPPQPAPAPTASTAGPALDTATAQAPATAAMPTSHVMPGAPAARPAVVPKSLSFLVDLPEAGGLEIVIRGGPQEVTIATVELDGTATPFTIDPAGPITPGATARITLARNFNIGEIRKVTLLTTDGQNFTREMARIGSALYSTRFGGAASTMPAAPTQ